MHCTCGNEVYPFTRLKGSDTMIVYDAFYILRSDKYYKLTEAMGQELMRVGIQLSQIQQDVLWRHKNTKECDVRRHAHVLLEEMKTAKYILLAGSDVTQALLGKNASDLYGLKVESEILGDKLIVVAPSITTIASTPIGEMRDAVRYFAAERRKYAK